MGSGEPCSDIGQGNDDQVAWTGAGGIAFKPLELKKVLDPLLWATH